MIEQAILYIQTVISAYGAWGVFIATLIEEIVSPIPSALVPLASGFFLLSETTSLAAVLLEALVFIALPVAIGITIGSSAVYGLAYWGGKPLIEKNHRWLGITWKDVERIERRVVRDRRDEVTLVLLRLVPIIPGVALSAFCGLVRYSFPRFVLTTFAGSGTRAFFLALLGWQAGEFYLKYVDAVSRVEKYVFIGVIAVVVLALAWYFLIRPARRAK